MNAELACSPCDRLAVVARARRDHTGRPLLGRQRRELVDGAADLEGAGALQVLGLEEHLTPAAARERLRHVDGRLRRDAADALARLLYVSELRCCSLNRHVAGPRYETPS